MWLSSILAAPQAAANPWTVVIVLIVAGMVLLMLETVLPGLVAGLAGLGCLIAAIAYAYLNIGTAVGHWVLIGVLAGLGIGVVLWLRFFPDSRIGKRFVSETTIGGGEPPDTALVGRTGVARTALRPSGVVEIDGRRLDVVAEGAMIDAGTEVTVMSVDGLSITVRAR